MRSRVAPATAITTIEINTIAASARRRSTPATNRASKRVAPPISLRTPQSNSRTDFRRSPPVPICDVMTEPDVQRDSPEPATRGRDDKPPERTVEIRRPPVLFDQTAPLVEQLERELDGVFVSYWNSPNASMRHDDVAALDHVLRRI